MLRKLIKLILNPFIFIYFINKLNNFVGKNHHHSKFLILDIDNTIADTSEYLKNKKPNQKILYKDISVLSKTIYHVNQNYSQLPVIFISHRNIFTYRDTISWLSGKISNQEQLLILVSNPEDKLYYINNILKNKNVVYYDDLSYNHENGEVLLYKKIINKISKLDLKYYDYNFIQKLNSKIPNDK